MRNWLRQNRRAFAAALRKLALQRSGGFVSALVIGIALSLPTGGYALLESLRVLAGRVSFEPQISVFLASTVTRRDADALSARLRADRRVGAVTFVGRDEALKQLQAADGLADTVKALGRNPLPDTLIVLPRDRNPAALDALAAELRGAAGVAQVQADTAWARRLAAFADLLRLALALVALLLAVGLVAVTFNTVRLQILTQRDEIVVAKLLGANDSFVRRPFLYLGALQGVAGGGVAVVIVSAGIALLNLEVAELARSYGSTFEFGVLSARDALGVIALAGCLGWAGAALSVSRHLREI